MSQFIQPIRNVVNLLSRAFYVSITNAPFDDADYEMENTAQPPSPSIRETDSVTETGGAVFTYGAVCIATLALIYNLKKLSNKKATFNTTDGTLILPENTTIVTREMIDPYRDSVTKILMPNGVVSIGGSAFAGCTGLTKITIPDSVKWISSAAFAGCRGLTAIEIPSSVTVIREETFKGCSGLTAIEIPSSVTTIGRGAFYRCSGLTAIEIPSSVTVIRETAFEDCTSLTSITIPHGVTSIGQVAFDKCTGLTAIEIPDSVISIKEGAFFCCDNLKYIIVPERFKNQTADFWKERGVYVSRTAIYGMQDLMQNSALQSKALQDLRGGVSSPAYQSLTRLNPLAHVPVSDLLQASSNLANLCLPSIVKGTGVVKATKVNWGPLLKPLCSKAVDCAEALAQWLSLYDIRNMQMAKVTAPRLEDTKATAPIPEGRQVVYYQSPAPQSEGLDKNPREMLSNTPPMQPELSPRVSSYSPSLGA